MSTLTPEARAALQAQQAEIAAQLAADNMATENARRADALAVAKPLVGIVGGTAWNKHVAMVTEHRSTALPPELFSAAEHYLNTAKLFGDRFAAYVAGLQPMTDAGPVPIPPQAPAPSEG